MKKLESELNNLRQGVVEMGQLAEKMVENAIQAITASDRDALISDVNDWESQLDQMELALDKQVIRLLTVYGPVAHDLRFVVSASRINAEFERIGDHAVNVCESIKLLSSVEVGGPTVQMLVEIGQHVREMVGAMMRSVRDSDPTKARQTILMDDQIEALNEQIVTQQLKGGGALSGTIAHVLIARSLERIADQCTNVCEEIVFLEQGADIRHQPLVLPVMTTTSAATSNV
jgi:phosphate transport system protein